MQEPTLHPLADPFQAIAEIIVETANGFIPHRPFQPYQREFAFAVVLAVLTQSSEELTALFARQSGKTETLARLEPALAIYLPYLAKHVPALAAFTTGVWIGVFAPVKDQASTSFERMIEVLESPQCMALMRKCGISIVENNKASRKLSNGSFIRIWSASPGSNIESKTLHLAICEEAQDITAYKIRKSIEPMLTSTAGTLIQIGTANGLKSLFWETIERNKKLQYKDSTRKLHFEYDWKTIVKYNSRYRAFLAKKVDDRGRSWVESDEFRMAYGCIFILERGQFLSFARFLELENLGANIPRGPYGIDGKCTLRVSVVAGIDWGKSSDSTVVTIIAKFGDRFQVVDWLELVGDNWNKQFETIIKWLKRFPTLELILAETNGVGSPMTDRLKQAAWDGELSCPVEGFVASESSNDAGYRNLMFDFVGDNRLLFPANEEARKSREYDAFAGQLTDVTKEYKGSLLKVHAPELSSGDGKGESEKHDDYASSLMIAYWAASKLSTDELYRKFFKRERGNNGNKSHNSGQQASTIRNPRAGLDILEPVVQRRGGICSRGASVQVLSGIEAMLRGSAQAGRPEQLHEPGARLDCSVPLQRAAYSQNGQSSRFRLEILGEYRRQRNQDRRLCADIGAKRRPLRDSLRRCG